MFAIGINVSKSKSTIAIIEYREIFTKPFTISHSQEGFQCLESKLKSIDKSQIKIVDGKYRYLSSSSFN